MDRFGQQQLVAALIGAMALMAGGFLFLLFNSPQQVITTKRITDYAAERSAGFAPDEKEIAKEKEPAKKVNIEGVFEKLDGKPGTTVANWTNFRGADFTNIVKSDIPLAESWPEEGPPKLWEIELGEGYAGPVVWKGAIYLIDYDEEKEGDVLRSFSMEDGKDIWRRFYDNPIKANHGYTRTVPAVTEDFVVSMGPACHVLCVSRESGDFRWGIDLAADYDTEVPLWYTGQCPLVDGDSVIIAPGGKALMMGVDSETGDILWETPNPEGWTMSHSSIIPMTLLGKKTYVYCYTEGVVGVSAEDGDRGTLLWETNKWAHGVTSPSPVPIDDERIFLTAGYGGGSMMLRLKEEAGKITTEPIYELETSTFGCEQQTPVFYQDHLFAILPKDGKALKLQFACLNTDGKIVWSSGKENRFGLGPFLLANDLFYLLDDHGKLTLVRSSLTGYEQLAQAEIFEKGHDAWAPMALIDGKLLVRDSRRMICLDVSAH